MIIMPKKEVVIPIGLFVGMKGFLRLETINKFSGKVTSDTGWFPNKLLLNGMDEMADRDFMTHCQVGTDGTAPTELHTGLLGYHAGTNTVVSNTNGRQGIAPYFGWRRRTFRFGIGTVAANLSEVGVGWASTGATLISRAQILDPILQTPTTVTPLADEFLHVSYELRYYPPLVDVTSPQVTLNGVVYDTITRAANVTDSLWSTYIGSPIGAYSSVEWRAYDGNIGTILTGPSGLSSPSTNGIKTTGAYVGGYTVQVATTVPSADWNLASGIRSMRIQTTAGEYQTQFNAASGGASIPKDVNYAMAMQWAISWGEKT